MAMDGLRRKSFIALLVVWSVLEHNGVHGNDIVVNCVAVSDMVPSTFGATLYKANLTSVCDLLHVSKVTYLLTYPTTATEVLCEQQLSPCNTVQNADGCRCVSDVGDAYSFEFNFVFNKSKHEGSKLTLTTDCVSSIVGGLKSTSPCDLKASPSSPGQDCPICKKGTDCDEPDLICLLFLLLLIPIAVVIIIVWYCFCHNGGINGNKKAKEVELKSSPQDQQTSIGNNLADGNVSGQRDNKVGTGHVATNGTS